MVLSYTIVGTFLVSHLIKNRIGAVWIDICVKRLHLRLIHPHEYVDLESAWE